MRIESAGLQDRAPGQPVLVFESGGGMALETWDLILTAVARDAPVLAYDRPGIGRSEWDEVVPTAQHSVQFLRDLLDTLEIEPPYILVGHSRGGVLIRFFAQQHPNDVGGMVYIDPADILESKADFVSMFASVGAPQSFIDEFVAAGADDEALARASPAQRAEWEAVVTFMGTKVESRGVEAPLPVPTAVLQSGRMLSGPAEPELREGLGAEGARAYLAAFREHRLERMRGLLPAGEGGSLHVVEEAGHFIHRNSPDAVIEAIRSIVTAASLE